MYLGVIQKDGTCLDYMYVYTILSSSLHDLDGLMMNTWYSTSIIM